MLSSSIPRGRRLWKTAPVCRKILEKLIGISYHSLIIQKINGAHNNGQYQKYREHRDQDKTVL